MEMTNAYILIFDLKFSNLIIKFLYCTSKVFNSRIFIFNFQNRIAEIHLSGFEFCHEPLFKTKQIDIIDCCQQIDVPIIIESILDKESDLEKEYSFVMKYLKK